MAIKPINFPMLGEEYTNALMRGLGKGQEYTQNLLMFPQTLKQQQLANILDQYKTQQEGARAPYYGRLAGAEVAKAEAEPGEMLARTGLYGEQAKRLSTMTPLEAHELELKNQFYPQLIQSQIEFAKNKALYGGAAGSGVGQHEIIGFQRQLQLEHPEWDTTKINQAASAYLSGDKTLSSGEKLPPLSGLSQTYVAQIQKRNSTAAIQNQASMMDVTAKDLNEIPIDSIASFAGPLGKFNFASESYKMMTGQPVSEKFRQYKEYQDVISIFAMDTLRKGFGTTVVPEYVNSTLGKAVNPQSDWWNDPEQVARDLNRVKSWVNKNAMMLTKKSTLGVGADISNIGKEQKPETGKETSNKKPIKVVRDSSGNLVRAS